MRIKNIIQRYRLLHLLINVPFLFNYWNTKFTAIVYCHRYHSKLSLLHNTLSLLLAVHFTSRSQQLLLFSLGKVDFAQQGSFCLKAKMENKKLLFTCVEYLRQRVTGVDNFIPILQSQPQELKNKTKQNTFQFCSSNGRFVEKIQPNGYSENIVTL